MDLSSFVCGVDNGGDVIASSNLTSIAKDAITNLTVVVPPPSKSLVSASVSSAHDDDDDKPSVATISCDSMRKKINTFLATKEMTQTKFLETVSFFDCIS